MNSNNLEIQKKKLLTFFKEKKFQEVIIEGVKLLEERQNDAQLIYILGLSSINLQNFSDAEKFFKKLIFLQKTAENFYTLGNIQKKQKNFEEAIGSFEEAIKVNPNFYNIKIFPIIPRITTALPLSKEPIVTKRDVIFGINFPFRKYKGKLIKATKNRPRF